MVQGWASGAEGLGLRSRILMAEGLGFQVRIRVWGKGSGFRALRVQVEGLGFGVPGSPARE